MKKLEKENNLIEEFKAIENKTFESIYKFTMWILRKIPFIGIQ